MIDEVTRLLARALFQRKSGRQQEALQAIVQACERLFSMEAAQLFQFTPDQHFLMLIQGEPPLEARDKVLIYASLCAEAGQVYAELGRPEMAQASRLNALRLTLKARATFGSEALPDYARTPQELLAALPNLSLDPEMTAWQRQMEKEA